MICKSCGNKLKSKENFCTICGTYNMQDDDLENDELGNIDEDVEIVEEEQETHKELLKNTKDSLLENYIGEDYKWICERPFNIYALLFSWMYFVYRKLYIIGIFGLILTGIVIKYLSVLIVPFIIISMLICGFMFNKIYLFVINKRISKIKNNSIDLNSSELLKKCRRKGGVNVVFALIVFLGFMAIMVLSYTNIDYGMQEGKYLEENSNNKANCKSLAKKSYNIVLSNETLSGEIEEALCEVIHASDNNYGIFLKLKDNNDTVYLYFENKDGYISLTGNTDLIETIEELEKRRELSETEKLILETSKILKTKYDSVKSDSEYEDKLIKNNADTKEKRYFVFTKDDILN